MIIEERKPRMDCVFCLVLSINTRKSGKSYIEKKLDEKMLSNLRNFGVLMCSNK